MMKRFLACAALFASASATAFAGTTGIVKGQIFDDLTHRPLAHAVVRIVSRSQVEETRTDDDGEFVFMSLAPDRYTLSMERLGYAPRSEPYVLVNADTIVTKDEPLYQCLDCSWWRKAINDQVQYGGRATTLDMYWSFGDPR